MKKIVLFLLWIPGIIFSQTAAQKAKIIGQTNTAALRELSAQYKVNFGRNRELAQKLAKLLHWETTKINGRNFSELIGVTKDGHPVYYTTYNEGAGITARANKLYPGGGLGLSIEGQNMVSGIWDAGAALASHDIFSGRLQIMDDCHENFSHSTHVAGTIIGSDQVQGGHARGMAFKASLHSYDWNNDTSEVAEAAADGLLLSNHSYGYSPYAMQDYQWGKYDVKSREFDEIMYNAPYYQFVCAAGNSRGNFNLAKNGYDLITGQAASKNGIAVGAVEEVLNYSGPASVILSQTSSWGPTDDGRIKPDICAKGVNTFSATNESNHTYGVASGTSMASPSVNGTLLLLQQYYNERNGSFMRAATLRGLMIHTADEAGAHPGPDYSFGWGLINAEKAANIITQRDLRSYILENTLVNNETYAIAVNAMGGEPLLATLCWTDPKGQLHSFNVDDHTPDLVNDLDIRITQAGDTFYPWKLNALNPQAAAVNADNTADNVEKAEIQNPSGNYIVTVSHKGSLQSGSQKYSLIISGVILKNFWLTAAQPAQNICTGEDKATYALALHLKGDFSENISFSAIGLPAGVIADFDPDSLDTEQNLSLVLENLASLPAGDYPFTVRAQSSSDVFEIAMTLKILSADFAAIALQQPSNNAVSVLNPVQFRWQQDSNVQQYEIQIATNSSFANIIESATINVNSFTSTLLTNDTPYYWRVRGSNQCGTGNFSAIRTFTTACIAPKNITLQQISQTAATIGWTSSATSWAIKVVPHDVEPSGNGTIISSNPYLISNLNPGSCYDFYFKNTCSTGGASWSEPFEFCTTPDYCGGDHFYDSGGPGGNYHRDEDKTTVIHPDNAGDRVRAVFNSFHLDNCCDYMVIFNGPDDSAPFLMLANGDNNPGTVASTDPSGALTFVFHSNGSDSNSGWDASIICEPLPACPNAPDNFVLLNAAYNAATVQWTDHTDATSWEVEVVAHNTAPTGVGVVTGSNPYAAMALQQNTCYDLYVRSICTGGTSGWAGPFDFCTRADYCGGDHFYDSGWANGNYENYEYKTTVIAPEQSGDRVRAVFNFFDIKNDDSFKVYNGPDTTYPVLYDSENNSNAPSTLASTDASGSLTFLFESDGFNNDDGWDASVICEPLPPCATFPSNIHAADITMSAAQIVWDNNCNPLSWEIEIVPGGTTPTGNGLAVSSNAYAFSSLASNSCYDVYIRSICGAANSAWSSPYTFCTLANYCAGDHFYDSGGANGNYHNDEYETTVIFPDQPGNRVKAVFNSFSVDTCCDRLKIYNGPTRDYPLIYTSSSAVAPTTVVSTDTSGALTFLFISNDEHTQAGWDATIICEALPQCASAPSGVHPVSLSSQTASLQWNENSNAASWEVKITLHNSTTIVNTATVNSNTHQFNGLSANTCYDFYVRSICSQGVSNWTSAYAFYTEPDYCNGTHFYDSGGAGSDYGANEDKTTVIFPGSAGQRVRAIFNGYDFESCCDYLKIYNGPDTTYPLLYNNAAVSPGWVASTDASGALTFEFHSDGSSNASGWDATILCESIPACPAEPGALYATAITMTGATLSWAENGTATTWEIAIVAHGTLPSGSGAAANSTVYTFNELIPAACYDFYVRSICETGTTGWAGPLTFCTLPDYCGGNHFYDSGGAAGNYHNAENSTTVIYPSSASAAVSAEFLSFNLEGCCDVLNIYDGPDHSYPLLFSGGFSSPGLVTSSDVSGALTFEFISDGNATASGWDAKITCNVLAAEAPESFAALEFYPNPVNRLLTVNAHEKVRKYAVYSIDGKLIFESQATTEKFDIDLQALAGGTYFVKLTNQSGAKTRTIKILKK